MTRALRTLVCVLAVTVAGPESPAFAQPKTTLPPDSSPSNEREPKTKEQLEAQQHFQRAKDLYQTGSYREAIAELEAARLLDPKGKDLVFNLGIVHEKLGKFDEAITFFRQYMEMEGVTSAERAKAENIIKRIEGAKREVPTKPAATAPSSTGTAPEAAPDAPRRRIDVATVNAGAVAILGLGVGTTVGILALSKQPSKNFVTGRDGSYEQLKKQQSDAHTLAIVSDVGFGVGIVAAAVTAYLYFGRTRLPPKSTAVVAGARPVPPLPPIRVSFVEVASGGVLLLGGSFR